MGFELEFEPSEVFTQVLKGAGWENTQGSTR